MISPNTAAVQEEQQPRFLLKELIYLNIITYGYLYNVADKLWYAADTVQDNRFFVLDENFINAHT